MGSRALCDKDKRLGFRVFKAFRFRDVKTLAFWIFPRFMVLGDLGFHGLGFFRV